MDSNAAVGSRFGVPTEKIDALDDYAKSPLFTEAEKVALEYADAITDMGRDVDDELFARLQRHYDDDTIAELTMIIAWENAGALPFGAPPVSAIEIAAPDLRRRAVVAQAPIGRARHAAMHAVRRHRAQARQSVPDPDRDCQIGPLKFD
jgi:hypothetical protein